MLFETSNDIAEIIENAFDEAGLTNYGINLKIMSTSKAKDVIKVSKASATTEFLAKKDGMVMVTVYEAAFDRLDAESQKILTEMAVSNVSMDLEKDKVNVETNPYVQLFNMRRKYGERADNVLEASYAAVQQILEEEKAAKEAKKQAKQQKQNED